MKNFEGFTGKPMTLVSLTVSVRNGAETCIFKPLPTAAAAVLNYHGRRRRGEHHEQRGEQCEQHWRHGGRASRRRTLV